MDYQDIELLRFTTAGSVDDGKSTLIGRLLYDSKSIFQDQYDQISRYLQICKYLPLTIRRKCVGR